MTGLKPCPFCGNAPVSTVSCAPNTEGLMSIGCSQDATICPVSPHVFASTRSGAITAWNHRSALPVEVRPLEWSEITAPREDGPREPTGEFEAICGFGIYSVIIDADEDVAANPFCVWSPEDNLGHFASVAEAKSAAQAHYSARVLSLLAELDASKARIAEGWQDIATAPMDGTRVLLSAPGHLTMIGAFLKDRTIHAAGPWWWSNGATIAPGPTHWQPLPPPHGGAK
jgi:hypothetical protein